MADSNPLIQALLSAPATSPPPGVTPNFVNPPSIGLSAEIVVTLAAVVASVMFTIRAFTKLYLIKAWNIEDYLIIPAVALQIFLAVETFLLVAHGAGADMWNLSLGTFLPQLYGVNVNSIVYDVEVALIKIAILLQFLRIFVPQRKANMALWLIISITITFIAIFYTATASLTIWSCNPREKIWNPFLPGTCFSSVSGYQTTGVFNVVSDFAILAIPIWPICKLHLPRGKKLAIIAVFATGFLDCITSIVRTYESWILVESPNVSHNVAVTACWAVSETGIGIVVFCLPVMPRFVQFLQSKSPMATKSSKASQGYDYSTKKSKSEQHSDTYPMPSLGTISRDGDSANKHMMTGSSIEVRYA